MAPNFNESKAVSQRSSTHRALEAVLPAIPGRVECQNIDSNPKICEREAKL